MELAFWLCFFWVFYAFAGYPLVVFLLARVIHRPVTKKEIFPRVTVIIAAYNEAQHIVKTVNNKRVTGDGMEKASAPATHPCAGKMAFESWTTH